MRHPSKRVLLFLLFGNKLIIWKRGGENEESTARRYSDPAA